MKNCKILLMAVALMAAMAMAACGSDDDAETMPQGGTVIDQTKLLGGWREVERRQVNADGSLQDPFDWTDLDGAEPEACEIRADKIYYFLSNYMDIDGYVTYNYTYDKDTQCINIYEGSKIQVLEVTDNSLKVVKPDWNNNNYQIIYKRMTDDSLKSYWEFYSVNLDEWEEE